MEVDFEVFDIESISKRIETLNVNLYSLENYGESMVGADIAVPVYKLTINYLTELLKDVRKLDPYSKGYAKRLNSIINLGSYSAGTNLFVDQCIRAVSEAEQIIKDGE